MDVLSYVPLTDQTWNKSSYLKTKDYLCVLICVLLIRNLKCMQVCNKILTSERRCVVIVVNGSHHVFPKVRIHLISSLFEKQT